MIKLEEKWILGKKKALFFLIVVLLVLSTASVATAAPSVVFNGNPVIGNAPLAVHFEGISNETVLWNWDFGDGSSLNVNPADHTYAIAGNLNKTYSVNLTVTSVNGTTSLNQTNYIKVLPPVTVANFIADPISGRVPLTVNFTDNSTYGPNSWSWQFGDGHTNTSSPVPNNTYSGIGMYKVNLTATNPGGSSNKSSVITVNPYANFTSDIQRVIENRPVQFRNISSVGTSSATDPIVSFLWNFGDGTTSTEQDPVHLYHAGKFTVNLTVTSKSGLTDTISKPNYIISDSGNLNVLRSGINGNTYFKASRYVLQPGQNVNLTAYSTRYPFRYTIFSFDSSGKFETLYTWEIWTNDGRHWPPYSTNLEMISSSIVFPDVFSRPGIYTVKLTVNDSRGSYTVTKPNLIVVR